LDTVEKSNLLRSLTRTNRSRLRRDCKI